MKIIPLTQGLNATVSDEDYGRVAEFKWCAARCKRRFEARRMVGGKIQRLHHFIYGRKIRLDHKDGNPLNNQRENLRPATNRENMQNRGLRAHSSRFKGVNRQDSKWAARIRVNGRLLYLGKFAEEELAAKAYDQAALTHFGEFARTNQQMGVYHQLG